MKKIVIILVIAVAVVILIFAIIYFVIPVLILGGFIPPAPSYNKLDRYLKENIDELLYIIDTFSEFEYDYVQVRKYPHREEQKNKMNVGFLGSDGEYIPISDELNDRIEKLYKSGVCDISCGRDSVDFCMWSSIGEHRGIAYSKNGDLPEVWAVIEIKPLSIENWYYYVSNFEKAKARNPELFK